MRLASALALLMVAAPVAAASPLDGTWTVDLSVKPNEPYTKPMVLTLNADGTVSGEFYQSTIEAGRWKTDRGRTCVSFRTTDGVGPYHTAACLVGDGVQGQTWAEQRKFLFNWNAVRGEIMASLKALKMRINSVKSTQKITRAMKTVAAAKLKRAQDAAVAGRPYAERLTAVMASLASRVTVSASSPKLLAGTGKDQVHLLVVATSERGLAGGFNTNIVRLARKQAEALEKQGKTVRFYLVGRKARVLNRFYPANAFAHDYDMSAVKAPTFEIANLVAKDLIARYDAGEFDVATLVYSKFRSVLAQEPEAQQIIPVPLHSGSGVNLVSTSAAAVEYEPDEETVLEALLPLNVAIQIYRAMLENNAGFYGSQMDRDGHATRNAGDVINRLTIQYNRTRQAAITTELVEIIAGAEAL